MASVLNTSLVDSFSPILLFLLVFAIVFGILTWSKLLGNNKAVHSIIALAIGLLVLTSSKSIVIIKTMIPWFVVIVILMFMIILSFKVFGVSDQSFTNAVTENGTLRWALIVVAILIFALAISSAYGQDSLTYTKDKGTVINESSNNVLLDGNNQEVTTTNTGNFQQNLGATIYNPKVLGLLLLLLIGVFTISQLSQGPS